MVVHLYNLYSLFLWRIANWRTHCARWFVLLFFSPRDKKSYVPTNHELISIIIALDCLPVSQWKYNTSIGKNAIDVYTPQESFVISSDVMSRLSSQNVNVEQVFLGSLLNSKQGALLRFQVSLIINSPYWRNKIARLSNVRNAASPI